MLRIGNWELRWCDGGMRRLLHRLPGVPFFDRIEFGGPCPYVLYYAGPFELWHYLDDEYGE